MGARAVEAVDAGRVGDEDRIGSADEEAALDDADDAPDAILQSRRIGDRAEAAVEDPVAAVGRERLARRRLAQPYAGTEHLEGGSGCFPTEGHAFHGNRCARAQPVDELRPVEVVPFSWEAPGAALE